MDILIDVVRDFLEHIDAFGGPKQHRGAVKCMYHEWRDIKGEALEAKIIETMRHIYSNPLFAEVSAKNGSILDEDGRMNPFVQLLFPASLPMNLQYAGNPRVFQAFASFAPAHLL